MRPCARSAPRVYPLHRRGCLSCWSTAPCLPFIPPADVTGDVPPTPTGGPPAPRPPRAFPGPLRAPSAIALPGKDPRHVAGAGRRGGGVPGQRRRERPWSFPPARSGTAGLGNPLTQISLYGIHPVRGGVTDGKRSRLQPSAAGGRAARGTGPDGTVRDATAPPPPPGGTLRGLWGTDTALGAAVPPQVTLSPQRGPAQPCRGARCSKEGGEEARLARAALCAASQPPSPALNGVCP